MALTPQHWLSLAHIFSNAGGGSLNEREQQYNIQLGLVSVIAPNLQSTDPATLYSDMAESEFFGTKTYEESRAAERAQARGVDWMRFA